MPFIHTREQIWRNIIVNTHTHSLIIEITQWDPISAFSTVQRILLHIKIGKKRKKEIVPIFYIATVRKPNLATSWIEIMESS